MNRTVLKNRTLWYDGDVSVPPECIEQYFSVSNVFVEHITPDIEEYNKLVGCNQRITVKHTSRPLDFKWNVPEEYLTLDVRGYVLDKLEDSLSGRSDPEIKVRISRVLMEFELYKRLNLLDALRAIIYVINRLDADKVVWGVGRGSSVSSYILYIIGVHDVDSVEYDLDIRDFLKE